MCARATNVISQTDFGGDGLKNRKVPATGLNRRNRDEVRVEQRQHSDEPPGLTATYAVRNQKCSARLHWGASSWQKSRALRRQVINLLEQYRRADV